MTKKTNTIISEKDIALMAVEASSRMLLQGAGGMAVGAVAGVIASPLAFSALIGAGAYWLGKLFLTSNEESAEKKFIDAINRTTLDVKVGESGDISTTVNTVPHAEQKAETIVKTVSEVKPLAVQGTQGTTVYYIENLNITLDVDMVHQLNLNPKEVINKLTEQLATGDKQKQSAPDEQHNHNQGAGKP